MVWMFIVLIFMLYFLFCFGIYCIYEIFVCLINCLGEYFIYVKLILVRNIFLYVFFLFVEIEFVFIIGVFDLVWVCIFKIVLDDVVFVFFDCV